MWHLKNPWGDDKGDPTYSYLYSYEAIRTLARWYTLGRSQHITILKHSLLRVEIDDQEVERDYDQILFRLYDRKITSEVEEGVKEWAKGYGIPLQKVSVKDIKEAIDSIPESSWGKWPGSYRTAKTITVVEVISWAQVTPKIIWLIGYLVRPLYALKFKFRKS